MTLKTTTSTGESYFNFTERGVFPLLSESVRRRMVELACHAPSVHNTQPWAWRASDNTLELFADHRRQLIAEDPAARNLLISCGAALDHLQYAARALGWDTSVTRFPEGLLPRQPLARISFKPGRPSESASADLEVLRTRCTDRRRFTSWPVPENSLGHLVNVARSRGARADSITDSGARFRLELLVHEAQAARRHDPHASAEQQEWVDHSPTDGIPTQVLPASDNPTSVPWARFGAGVVEETRTRVDSGEGIIALGGDADSPDSWLRSGEALSSLWLDATRSGLSVVPLSLPVEVESVRTELRESVLPSAFDLHVLARIGWQVIGRRHLSRTPRRSVADVLWP